MIGVDRTSGGLARSPRRANLNMVTCGGQATIPPTVGGQEDQTISIAAELLAEANAELDRAEPASAVA